MRMTIALALLLSPSLARAQEPDVSEIDDQLRENPESVELRLDRAEDLLALGRFDEALVDCDLAASLAPNDRAVSLTRARIHLAMGELELAEEHFTSYLERGPASVEVYMLRGGIREETERHPEALADYDSAKKLAVQQAKAKRSLDQLLQMIEIEEARARSLEALKRTAEAKAAREHAEHLKSLTGVAHPSRDT
jgi:tetratricopeptide (TPR) repeat protein